MNNSLTWHARKRLRQRGISEKLLYCLMEHGRSEYAHGGAIKISLTRRNANKVISKLKREIRSIECAVGKSVIEKEGKVLTVYHGI